MNSKAETTKKLTINFKKILKLQKINTNLNTDSMGKKYWNSSSTEEKGNCCYEKKQTQLIENIYIFSILFWIVLIIVIGIFPGCSFLELFILLIPILVFLVCYNSAKFVTTDVENFVTTGLLSFVLILVVVPILTLVGKRFPNDILFLRLGVLAITFGVLSLLDVWVSVKYISIIKHVRSILRTFAITLVVFILLRYFIAVYEQANCKRSDNLTCPTQIQVSGPPEKTFGTPLNQSRSNVPGQTSGPGPIWGIGLNV